MTALDVGANKGVTTVTLAKAVGETGRVWAFEPVPEHFAALQANLSQNNAANAHAFQVALADAPGEVDFYVHGEGSGIVPAEGAQRLKIAATTIDSFLQDHGIAGVDLISSDCEGSELLVLRGAEHALASYAPQVFCEVHHGYLSAQGKSVRDVVDYLRQLGFEVRPIAVERLGSDVGLEQCSHIYAAM
jgi:FkbM family methyltransferase